jgi:HEAT repeat protein
MDDAQLRALIEAGDYRGAYEQSLESDRADTERLAATARALLGVTIQSNDAYLRSLALRASASLKEPALAEGARSAAHSADRYEQSLAIEILGNTDPAGSREQLLEALQSPFRGVRLRALRALAKLKDPRLADRIGDVLTADPDPDLRALAARALAETGAPAATLLLHQALDDQVAAVQEQIVLALVTVHDRELVNLIRRRLANDPAEKVVQNLRLAALIPDPSLVPDLGPFLANAEPEVRALAAAAILSILEQAKTGSGPLAR